MKYILEHTEVILRMKKPKEHYVYNRGIMGDMGIKIKNNIDKIILRGALIIVLTLYLIANFNEGAVFRGILKYGSIEKMVRAEYQYIGEETTEVTALEIDQRENVKETTSITYCMEFCSKSGRLKIRKFISRDEYNHLEVGDLYHNYYIFKNIKGGYLGYQVDKEGNSPMEVLMLELHKKFWQSQIFLIFIGLIVASKYGEKIILGIKSYK